MQKYDWWIWQLNQAADESATHRIQSDGWEETLKSQTRKRGNIQKWIHWRIHSTHGITHLGVGYDCAP